MWKDQEQEPYLTTTEKFKLFMVGHWRGAVIIAAPLLLITILVPFPPEKYQWAAYCLLLMAIYWVTECLPLAVTSFLPVVIFPLTDVMDTRTCCRLYVNDSVMMFLASLMLAASVEQSGLHKRLAYHAIRMIGYSHYKLLLAMCCVTTFVSMWITNTAATTMMVPINFALLKVFEDQKVIAMFETTPDGERVATDTTCCYFCSATFSASIGGIGTLVGTATNLIFKGLFATEYPNAPEYLSFPKFSAFAIPYMIILEACLYFYMIVYYFGYMRPMSAAAKASIIPIAAQNAAKAAIAEDMKRMGKMTCWEIMVCVLFGTAIISFFCRSPQLFPGWGDAIIEFFGISDTKFIRDSALGMFIAFLMFLIPRSLVAIRNFTAKYVEDLPKSRTSSVLDWRTVHNTLPFGFCFLLGGGFALSVTCKTSGLNVKIGESMHELKDFPNMANIFIVIIVVVVVTNFASNAAVCNVFTPIAMQLAKEVNQNPLWYNIASGFAASFCFMIPVGTPGNLVVQSAALIPTQKMIIAGFGPTVSTILITWLAVYYWAPIIWPDLETVPEWASAGGTE